MKIIFLDIDGVLVTTNNGIDGIMEFHEEMEKHTMFDKSAVHNLNRLIEAIGARIVISSSWRMTNSVPELESILRRGGVEHPGIIGVTPFITDGNGRSNRGMEILAWLAQNPAIEDYIVIDDYGEEQLKGIPSERVVQTTLKYGFGDEKAYRKAVQVFKYV